MLFITDQHHMDDLEQKVVRVYGKKHSLRLMGDMSPTQIQNPENEQSTFLKLKRLWYKEEKKKEDPRFDEEEMPFEDKIEADKQNILKDVRNDAEAFLEHWVCFYGGASIANLARKYYINTFSKDATICLRGSEPVIDKAQKVIYKEIMDEYNISPKDVMAFILETISTKQSEMYNLILKQLEESGATSEPNKFILDKLSTKHYGGKIPVCSDVYKGYPKLKGFKFKKDVWWEKEKNCVIIHVPVFSTEKERCSALKKIPKLENFLNSTEGSAIIAYHGNPFPSGMNDENAKKRKEYNYEIIKGIAKKVFSTIAKDPETKPQMLCGHLHKSNGRYDWKVCSREIELIPLGTRDMAFLNTSTGKIKSLIKY